MIDSPAQHGGQTLTGSNPTAADPGRADVNRDPAAPVAADPWGFDEPFAPFAAWMRDAEAREPNDPNAMALATVDAAGLPDVRMVLLKGTDSRGFVFYSNRESAKGQELAARPGAALVLHWKSLRRQVRIRGPVEEVTVPESDDYFATRPRGSRIAAIASQQSRPLESRAALEAAVAELTARFGEGEIQRPDHWIGWRVRPVQVEFWQDKPFRLHDRVQFARPTPEADGWTRTRLFP